MSANSPHRPLSTDSPPPADSPPAWQLAHENLVRLATTRARLDWEEGTSLLLGLRSGVHLHLGYGTFADSVNGCQGAKQDLRAWVPSRRCRARRSADGCVWRV